MKGFWWKILCMALLSYTILAGFLGVVPRRFILNESIRNLYFHVPMWFGMIFLLLASSVASILYLKKGKNRHDRFASQAANTGIVFGILGLVTGMVWAKYTWGSYWSGDPKQNASAIGMLIYLAYFVLRGSLEDPQKKARISAVYNIFAFAMLIPLLFILPRLTDSLHPGNGGNPGFNSYDLDSNMRKVFYPAVVGWTLLGFWITDIRIRISKIEEALDYE
ncbi:MAG TPA: ABC transporter permease [Cytophagales bacterium]|nr:ABC transporter permease [Cytophagales bacterium]